MTLTENFAQLSPTHGLREVAAKLIATGMSKAEAASLVGLSEEDLDS